MTHDQKEEQLKNRRKLYKFFKRLHPDSLCLTEFYSQDIAKLTPEFRDVALSKIVKENSCGSYACFAGWLPYEFPEYFLYTEKNSPVSLDGRYAIDACKDLFGLSEPGLLRIIIFGKKPCNTNNISEKESILRFIENHGI